MRNEEEIFIRVKCPLCDTFLFECTETNMAHKCPKCHKGLFVTVEDGIMLLNVQDNNEEDNYKKVMARQIRYLTRMKARNK